MCWSILCLQHNNTFKCIYIGEISLLVFFLTCIESSILKPPGTLGEADRPIVPPDVMCLTQHCDIQLVQSTCSQSVIRMQSLLHMNQMAKSDGD